MCPTGESRRRGHQGSQRPLRGAPANLRPSRPVTGEGTRPGKQGRGCGVGEPRREFRGGPCLTHRSPFVLAAAPQSRGEGGGWWVWVASPVPSRPGPQPHRRAVRASSASAPWPASGARARPSRPPSPHPPPAALPVRRRSPRGISRPATETLPPGEPPAGAARRRRGGGGGGFALRETSSEPIGCLAAPPLLLPAPPGRLRAPIGGGGGGDARQAGLRKRSEEITCGGSGAGASRCS